MMPGPQAPVETSDVRAMLDELRARRRRATIATVPAVDVVQIYRPTPAVASVEVTLEARQPRTAAQLVAIALEAADENGDYGYTVTTDAMHVDPRDPEPLTGFVTVTIHRD